MRNRAAGRNRGDRLSAINSFMAKWYRDHPGWHRLPPLRPGDLRALDPKTEVSGGLDVQAEILLIICWG